MTIPQTKRFYFLVIFSALIVGSCALLTLGVIPDIIWGHDLTHHMDAAWRMAQGQIPRIDYYHHAYEAYHGTIALFIRLIGPHVYAITITHIFYFVVLVLAAWQISSSRFVVQWAAAISVLFLILLLGLSPLGLGYGSITHGEYHNRIGWAVLTLILIFAFFEPLKDTRTSRWIDPMIGGLLLGFLLVMKASYFLVALTAIGVGFYYETIRKKHLAGFLVGFAVVFLAYTIFIHGRWFEYVRTNASLIRSFQYNPPMFVYKSAGMLPFLAFLPAVFGAAKKSGLKGRTLERLLVYYVFVILAGLGIIFTNLPQPADIVVYLVIPLLILRYVKSVKEPIVIMAMVATTGTWVVGSLFSVPQAFLIKQWIAKQNPLSQSQMRMDSESYRGWASSDGGGPCNPQSWLERVNEGIAQLRKHSDDSEKITTLDYSNIFPFALRRPSPLGGSILFHYGLNVDEDIYPDPQQLFRDTDVVMVPKSCPENESAYVLKEKYEKFLGETFPIKFESKNWVLRKRQPSHS